MFNTFFFKLDTLLLNQEGILGRLRSRRKGIIRMDLKETGISTRTWTDSAQDRYDWRALVNAALRHSGSISHAVSYSL